MHISKSKMYTFEGKPTTTSSKFHKINHLDSKNRKTNPHVLHLDLLMCSCKFYGDSKPLYIGMLKISTLHPYPYYMAIKTLYFHRSGKARQAQLTKPETGH
jgi:hypothetical protein